MSSERVDVLCHPTRGDDVFNHVLAREASENDVAVEFNLSRILRSSGGERVSALGSTRELLKLVRKYSTPFVISGDPSSHLELRAPREVGALCRVVGFEESELEEGMERTPSRI
ncbi:MAG: RNase P subunit p30 family protein, partial [Halobacteria archaeon]|nr:RNase P subunit p30 family protein [Halobacteria archaeon]